MVNGTQKWHINVWNWLVFGSKRLTLVKDSNHPAKFKSLSIRQYSDGCFLVTVEEDAE